MILNVQLTNEEALEILKKTVGKDYAKLFPDAQINVEILSSTGQLISSQEEPAKVEVVSEEKERETPFEVEGEKVEENDNAEPAKKSLFSHLTR